MSDDSRLVSFESPAGCVGLALPFELDAVIRDWVGLRRSMVRELDEHFTRPEWAYLITFLDEANLRRPFRHHFGDEVEMATSPMVALVRPRGPVALWLPNNVSLLGPLSLILLSLTGNLLRIKGGSRADDLTGAFLDFARRHLPDGELKDYLGAKVRYEVFERQDPRHATLAAGAKVRIVFGSDDAAEAIDRLPHPIDSVGCYFTDRYSEAWLESGALTDEVLAELLQVFAIYGQTGCTSPGRVVLLDGDAPAAVSLRDRLVELWPQVIKRDPPPHLASENVMARQWSAALGWDAVLTARHGAVLVTGPAALERVSASLVLPVVSATLEEAGASLPENVQTIGYVCRDHQAPSWLGWLASSSVKRLVPVGRMHHFGPVWDGRSFWYECFEQVQLGT